MPLDRNGYQLSPTPFLHGEILRELIIEPLELTVTDVAGHLNVSRKTLSKVINGRGATTPESNDNLRGITVS